MMTKRTSLTVLSLAAILFASHGHSNAAPKTVPSMPEGNATKSADAVAKEVYKTHKLTKQDFTTIYDGLKAKSFSDSNALAALTALIAAKNLTPLQKRQIGDLCIAMLPTPYPNDGDNEIKPLVITVLGSIGDKRATMHLVPLLKAPEDTTRLAAQSALKDLGYPAPSISSLLY